MPDWWGTNLGARTTVSILNRVLPLSGEWCRGLILDMIRIGFFYSMSYSATGLCFLTSFLSIANTGNFTFSPEMQLLSVKPKEKPGSVAE